MGAFWICLQITFLHNVITSTTNAQSINFGEEDSDWGDSEEFLNFGSKDFILNEKIYSNIFVRRREEQKTLLNHLISTEKYEKKYKLLEVGYEKLLSVIIENKDILHKSKYLPEHGFPKKEKEIDAFTYIIENTCLFSELYIHMPDMSSSIVPAMLPKWKLLMNWALNFVKPYYNTIIDVKTQRLLSIFNQLINPEKRTPSFINPYEADYLKKTKKTTTTTTRKPRPGPRLGNAKTDL